MMAVLPCERIIDSKRDLQLMIWDSLGLVWILGPVLLVVEFQRFTGNDQSTCRRILTCESMVIAGLSRSVGMPTTSQKHPKYYYETDKRKPDCQVSNEQCYTLIHRCDIPVQGAN